VAACIARGHIIRTSDPVTLAALGKSDKGACMTKRIQKLFLTVAALGALAVGASAIASAQQQPAQPQAPATQSAPSSGSAGAPDTATSGAQEAPGTEAPDATDKPDANDPAGAAETPDANETPGSESATGSDGPGGHADEPANPSADHQATGQE
jgi:hypothetical protein